MWIALLGALVVMGLVGWYTVRDSLGEIFSIPQAPPTTVALANVATPSAPTPTEAPRVFVSSSRATSTPISGENSAAPPLTQANPVPTKDWFELITTLGGIVNPPVTRDAAGRNPTPTVAARPTTIARQPPAPINIDVPAAIATARAAELTPPTVARPPSNPPSMEVPYVPEQVVIGETATPLSAADLARSTGFGPPARSTIAVSARTDATPIPSIPSRSPGAPTPTVLSVQPEGTPISASTGQRSASANSSALATTATPTFRPSTRRTPRAATTPRTSGAPRPTAGPTRTARPFVPATPWAGPIPANLGQPRNGANKWGLGVYKDSNRAADIVKESAPGVILLMDPSVGWAKRIRELAPNAFIVGRRFRTEVDQPLDFPEQRGEEFADMVAETAVPLRGIVDAWMSYNEVLGSTPNQSYSDYNRFQLAFARRLQNIHGIAAVAGNDGSGALEPDDYPIYFAESIRASRYFGIHAYSPPATNDMKIDAEWNALRYRKIHDALERAGIRDKQMVITESGLGDGFREGQATDEQMANDIVWFTRELAKDSYMIGHAVFGLFDATGNWARFDLTETTVARLVSRLLTPGR